MPLGAIICHVFFSIGDVGRFSNEQGGGRDLASSCGTRRRGLPIGSLRFVEQEFGLNGLRQGLIVLLCGEVQGLARFAPLRRTAAPRHKRPPMSQGNSEIGHRRAGPLARPTDGLLCVSERRFGRSCPQPRQIVAGIREVGLDFQGPLVMGDRLVDLSAAGQG